MSILSPIQRDTNNGVSIVRMHVSDTISQVEAVGYIANNQQIINQLNSGTWQWYLTDVVLVAASDGNQFYYFNSTSFATLIPMSSDTGNIVISSGPTSFIPGMSFGGGTTGITYSVQTGFYRVLEYVNNIKEIQAWGQIVLSNKGSSTGGAQLTGLPVASGPNGTNYIATITPADIASADGAIIFGQLVASTSKMNIDYTLGNGGGYTALTDANFANASSFFFSVNYLNN